MVLFPAVNLVDASMTYRHLDSRGSDNILHHNLTTNVENGINFSDMSSNGSTMKKSR